MKKTLIDQIPATCNKHSAYSRMKSNRSTKEMPAAYTLANPDDLFPYIPTSLFSICSLNLALFPFSKVSGYLFFNFLSYTRSQFYLLQEVKNIPLLRNLIQIWNARFPDDSYRVWFSPQPVIRSSLGILVSNNWLSHCSARQIYFQIFQSPEMPLRSPLALFTSFNSTTFCLVNIHAVPYGCKNREKKFQKFWNLLSLWVGHQYDVDYVIVGGDYNARPVPVPLVRPAYVYSVPGPEFENQIDYFSICGSSKNFLRDSKFHQESLKSDLLKKDIFKNWKSQMSDHFPVLLDVYY